MFDHNQKINPRQKILTSAQYRQLVKNHNERMSGKPAAKHPVVKFFTTSGAAVWLLTELDPDTGHAFGLCDLGHGYPELGYVSLPEMIETGRRNARRVFHWVERDLHFKGEKTLDKYKADREAGKPVYA